MVEPQEKYMVVKLYGLTYCPSQLNSKFTAELDATLHTKLRSSLNKPAKERQANGKSKKG